MANTNFISSSLFGWGDSFDVTGKFPLIAKRVWNTYNDMINFVGDMYDVCISGIILTVVNDEDSSKNGAYFVVSCPTLEDPGIPTEVRKIETDAKIVVSNYNEALTYATGDRIGAMIYVTGDMTSESGLYVVTRIGVIEEIPVGVDGNIAEDVRKLKNDVTTLKGDANTVGSVDYKLTGKLDKGEYTGSAQDLKTSIDNVSAALSIESSTRHTELQNINAKIGGDYGSGEGQITVADDIKSAKDSADFAVKTINAFLDANAIVDETIDTLKEIQKYITEDTAMANILINRINTNEVSIQGLDKKLAGIGENETVKGLIDNVVGELESDDCKTIKELNEEIDQIWVELDEGTVIEKINSAIDEYNTTVVSPLITRVSDIDTTITQTLPKKIEDDIAKAVLDIRGENETDTLETLRESIDGEGGLSERIESLETNTLTEIFSGNNTYLEISNKNTITPTLGTLIYGSAVVEGIATNNSVKTYVDEMFSWAEFN